MRWIKIDNYFGIRFLIIVILVITLSSSIISATSTQTLLSPMILFLLPLTLDYFKHNPKSDKDIKRKNIGIWLPAITSVIFIAIILGGINLDILTNYFLVKLFMWFPFIYFVFMAGIDWSAYSNNKEKNRREFVKHMERSVVFDSHQKRVKDYSREEKRNLNPE